MRDITIPRNSGRTTELRLIRNQPQRFVWGEVADIHDIGPYTILAYHPWKREGNTILTRSADHDQLWFSGYIDDRSTHESWTTLDAALAGLIAYRHTGGSLAGEFFMRMIRTDKGDTNENVD